MRNTAGSGRWSDAIALRIALSEDIPRSRLARVSIEVHQFAAGGVTTEYTDSDGVAEFELDVDQFAEISIYVDGTQRSPRGPIRAQYKVVV